MALTNTIIYLVERENEKLLQSIVLSMDRDSNLRYYTKTAPSYTSRDQSHRTVHSEKIS